MMPTRSPCGSAIACCNCCVAFEISSSVSEPGTTGIVACACCRIEYAGSDVSCGGLGRSLVGCSEPGIPRTAGAEAGASTGATTCVAGCAAACGCCAFVVGFAAGCDAAFIFARNSSLRARSSRYAFSTSCASLSWILSRADSTP